VPPQEDALSGAWRIAAGASVSQAAWTLEELEETARLWLMTEPRPVALTELQIDELRTTFGARW